MDLDAEHVRESLDVIDVQGWDGPVGRALLETVRRRIVRPIVRRTGASGAAARQAEATGWEVAWETLKRPSTRAGLNPAAMVWAAVRRSVWAELVGGRSPGDSPLGGGLRRQVSLDQALAAGLQLADEREVRPRELGPRLEAIVGRLARHSWDPDVASDAVALIADQAVSCRAGGVATRWRLAALRLGVPEWRARRLAVLLLGLPEDAGLVAQMVTSGNGVLDDPALDAWFRWTSVRSAAAPVTRRPFERGAAPMARPGGPVLTRAALAGWQPEMSEFGDTR